MIHFSNQFQIYVQGDSMVRIDFNVADPMHKEPPTTASSIYMKNSDAKALIKVLTDLLEAPLKPGEGVRMN